MPIKWIFVIGVFSLALTAWMSGVASALPVTLIAAIAIMLVFALPPIIYWVAVTWPEKAKASQALAQHKRANPRLYD